MSIRMTEVLNSEYSELDDIGRIVEQDAGLTTKLLHIVNSAQFGAGREIASPTEAVQLLGVEVLRALMLGAQVFNFYDQTPFVKTVFKDLWSHSLRTAIAARKIAVAEKLPIRECEECFLAGLLHDIGKLILAANSPAEYKLVLDLIEKNGLPVFQAEMGIYGSTHAQIGAYLLALWGVSDTVIRSVEMHHSLDSANISRFDPIVAVHVAQCLEPEAGREDTLDPVLLTRLGLMDRLPEWKETIAPAA